MKYAPHLIFLLAPLALAACSGMTKSDHAMSPDKMGDQMGMAASSSSMGSSMSDGMGMMASSSSQSSGMSSGMSSGSMMSH